MDNFKEKKYLYIALMILGTSPYGTIVTSSLLGLNLGVVPDALVFVIQLFIFTGSMYVHFYCFQRMQSAGYSNASFIRLFIPLYGLYFAYILALKLLSSDFVLAQQPKSGKGLNF